MEKILTKESVKGMTIEALILQRRKIFNKMNSEWLKNPEVRNEENLKDWNNKMKIIHIVIKTLNRLK
tara:strand:- start:98 stop:298 length:201 start_codon:yes stop_codon:yes gene_type:complete